jgi:hypothetical protein
MQDELIGEFQLLPGEVVQVESGLEAFFQSEKKIANQTDYSPRGMGLACRCIDTLGSVRNGWGRQTGRY